MREITKCKLCNKDFELTQSYKICVNLGCTEYNKRIRRNNASKQKRYEKKIRGEEEE